MAKSSHWTEPSVWPTRAHPRSERRVTTSIGVLGISGAAVSSPSVAPPRIRVLTVDDHPLLQAGMAAVIRSQEDMELVGEAASGADGIQLFRTVQPDVTLMDLRLPDISGVEATTRIRSEFPEARIIILTTFDGDVEVRRALDAGARSYVLKSTALTEIVQVIRQVHAGRRPIPTDIAAGLAEYYGDDGLTGREVEVLHYIASGNRNRDVGVKLSISEETVKVHMRRIMEKLGAIDRTQAVSIAVRRGIIQL
jgi:DNA-binding NarL/FixJ family response regulator